MYSKETSRLASHFGHSNLCSQTVDSYDNEDDLNQIKVRVMSHTELHIGPDEYNSALRLRIKEFQIEAPDGSMLSTMQADATDYGPAESNSFRYDSQIHLGQIPESNADFIDVTKNGAGIIKDIIADPFGPFTTNDPVKVAMYQEPHADCIRFVQEIEHRLFPTKPPNPDLVRWVAIKNSWHDLWEGYSRIVPMKISATKITVGGDASKNEITRYNVPGPDQLEMEFSNRPQGSGIAYADEHISITPNQRPLLDPANEGQVGRMSLATGDGGEIRNPLMPGDVCRRVRRHSLMSRQCSGGGSDLVKTGRTEMVFARVNKIISTMKLVTQDVAVAAGVAGVALGAAFVILDFVHGEWVGGAFGAAVRQVLVNYRRGTVADRLSGPRIGYHCWGRCRGPSRLDHRRSYIRLVCNSPWSLLIPRFPQTSSS
ncbi:MAG: hypothetical protein L6R42_003291 [Xanthoria sp. 1 TBL-2021]|nr:MAG: hypothetical protein L6R42_003291 [Xanthoria sp. 1 TBL-2021]